MHDWKCSIREIVFAISRISRFIISVFSHKFNHRKYKGEAKQYCFSQQLNDSCHLSPIKNLEALENLRKNGYEIRAEDYKTRREWLGDDQKMLMDWHVMMKKLTSERGREKYPHFYRYVTQGIEEGPIFPHFFDQQGKRPFKGISGLLEFSQMPYFLIDIDGLLKVHFNIACMDFSFEEVMPRENLGLKTAFVKIKGEYKVYNLQTKQFDPLKDKSWVMIASSDDGKDDVLHILHDEIPAGEREKYPIPPRAYSVITMRNLDRLGFQKIGVIQNLGDGLDVDNKTYFPFQMALMKLLFLAVGIDENNEPIGKEHDLYLAYKEFRHLMKKNPDGYWHPKRLNREMLMQYQLAKIFKENPDLFKKAEITVDSLFNFYQNYNRVLGGNFYNEKGEPIAHAAPYLLGREQVVAYFFMQNIRMAWYSSINPSVYLSAHELGLPKALAVFVHEDLKRKLERIKTVELGGLTYGTTFIQVWHELIAKLRATDRSDFISFDDHGWVVTFDQEVIDRQNGLPHIHDKDLLEKLKVGGVESWWGSELNLWYAQNNERFQAV